MQAPKAIFCDTSFFYAALINTDADHIRAQKIAKSIARNKIICYTTWDVVSETLTLLMYRAGYLAACKFIEEILPEITIIEINQEIRNQALQTFIKYNRDHRLSFCDCISYVVVTNMLDNIPCAAFDQDFESLGLHILK